MPDLELIEPLKEESKMVDNDDVVPYHSTENFKESVNEMVDAEAELARRTEYTKRTPTAFHNNSQMRSEELKQSYSRPQMMPLNISLSQVL